MNDLNAKVKLGGPPKVKLSEIEILRQKKEELLKIQKYVQQSLNDIHSKLNVSDFSAEKEIKSTYRGPISKQKKKVKKTKNKENKALIRNASRVNRSKPSDSSVTVPKNNFLLSKRTKKVSKKLGNEKEARLTRNITQMPNQFSEPVVSEKKRKHNFAFEESMNILTTFDHITRDTICDLIPNQTPAYRDVNDVKTCSVGSRDVSTNSRNTVSQRRDRSTRNQQKQALNSSFASYDNNMRSTTPEQSRNVVNTFK